MLRLRIRQLALAAALLAFVGKALAQSANVELGPVNASAPRGGLVALAFTVDGPQAAAVNSFGWRLEVSEAVFEPLCGGAPCANFGAVDCTVTSGIPVPDPESPVDFIIPPAPGVPFVRVRYAADVLGATLGRSGVVFTCRFKVKATAPTGEHPLTCATSPTPFASDAGGAPLDPVVCIDGALEVLPAPATATPGPPAELPCVGDCTGKGAVTVVDLLRGVNISLGTQQLESCPSFDTNGDAEVTVNELIQGVNAALLGCSPVIPTPTPTPRPNTAPILSPAAVYHAVQGYEIRLPVGADDPDGDNLQCAADDLPEGASLDADTGVFTWTPREGQAGPFYVPFTCTDDGVPPKSASEVLALQVSPPDPCVVTTCDAETGCESTGLPVTQSCCIDQPSERAAYVEAACPDGAVLFAGGNNRYGIGRLQDCDFLRVFNYLQIGATVRLNVEARCLRTDRAVRVRARLDTPRRVLFDSEQPVFLQRRDDGYADRYGMILNVLGTGPFFDLDFAEAKLTVTATDVDGTTVQTQRRVILTFDALEDLIDPVGSPRPAPEG